jgi:hypothetical protein
MVPGLLPIEALSQEMQKAMGATTSQIGIGRFLRLAPEERAEVAQDFPGIAPTTDGPGFQIPDIPVPTENFKFPDEIVVSARNIRFDDVTIPIEVTDRLSDTLSGFITQQEQITQKWADIFSQQKQTQAQLDVDVNFAGVQGPLSNLVSTFTSIVEQRLEEKIDDIALDLRRAAEKPTRPNVNAEAI